jgi:hypothetical protein
MFGSTIHTAKRDSEGARMPGHYVLLYLCAVSNTYV